MQPFTFFLSYRRGDTAPLALLLKSEIERRLELVRVWVDVDAMRPGESFPDRLRTLIDGAHVTIALVGRHWMPLRQEPSSAGSSEQDWVVTELQHSYRAPLGLSQADKRGLEARQILPIFVDGEPDFARFDLPPDLAFLRTLHAERIDHAHWPRAIGPLVDAIGRRFSLSTRPDKDSFPKPDRAKAETQPVSDAELDRILGYEAYDGWYVDNFGHPEARYLVKSFQFADFDEAADFMHSVADHCRVIGHHPEWRNVFRQVTVSLTTWDAKRRITIFDLNLALYMNKAAARITKRA